MYGSMRPEKLAALRPEVDAESYPPDGTEGACMECDYYLQSGYLLVCWSKGACMEGVFDSIAVCYYFALWFRILQTAQSGITLV